ncbi:hypothetical protein KCM76_17165 [Zooshikella marina]|uniref:hypothetical protein n=1 Tax=Zooshikella ganghwensis TaxID=202772 RepID=UPI001BB08CCB|nr:hypothetical protein [Zooshikella ganghwensis]MBU2707726.1 hypothetical protein [Zooshikella ganghwensis]
MNMSDVMAYLLSRLVTGLPVSELANVFDCLIWCMDDNGADIEAVRQEWLLSDDKRKVEVALSMSETYPYDSRQELIDGLKLIKNKWPDLEPKCNEILGRWDKQFPNN